MSFEQDFESIIRIAHSNEELRQNLMPVIKKHAPHFLQIRDAQRRQAEQWSQDVDIEENKMHELLDVPEDEQIKEQMSSTQVAQQLVDAVGQSEAASMLAIPANLGNDEFYQEALDYVEEEIPNE